MSLGLPPTLPAEDALGPPSSASPQELEAQPGLARLLRGLGGILGCQGLSPHLHSELTQAEQSLGRARALWLPLELLWRLLGELIRDPRGMEPSVLRAVEQELTWAQVRRGPPDIARLLPPRQPPLLLPRLLPELERRLREKREELQNFLLGPPKNPQNPPKNTQNLSRNPQNLQNPPKNPQNPPKNPQIPPKNLQNPAKNTQISSKNPQNPSKNTQNLPKNPQNLPKMSQNLPENAQNPPKNPQIPPKNPQNPQNPLKNPQIPPQNPPKMPQNPLKNPQILPKNPQILPQNPQILPQTSQILPQNPQNPQVLPQNPQILPQNPPNLGGILGSQRLQLQRERRRERLLREELHRMGWKYPQVLHRCLSHLSHAQALGCTQAHLERGRGRYLQAKGGAVLLKGRLEELRVLLDSYPAPTIEAHRRIRSGLSAALGSVQSDLSALWAGLGARRALGAELGALAQEMGRVQQELGRKRWALRQLRPL